MARDIRRIISKTKWTGEELGRILLAEAVRSIQAAKGESTETTPIVTDEDLSAMESGLETERNYNVYNTYRNLYFQLVKTYNQCANHMSNFQGAYNREIMHLSDCYNHERTMTEQSKLPIMVTKSKYAEIIKEAREDLARAGESYAGLVITLAGWFADNTDQAPAGFAEALEDTKQEQVTNKDIAQLWLDYIEGYCLVLPNGLRSDTATKEEWEEAVKVAFMEKHSGFDTINNLIEESLPGYCIDTTDFGRCVAFNKYAQNKIMLKWFWGNKEELVSDLKMTGKSHNLDIDNYRNVLQGMFEEDNTDLYNMLDISNYSKEKNNKAIFKYAEDDVSDVLLYEELPQTVTKYDILKEGYYLYYGDVAGEDPKEMFKAFVADYPALHAVLDKYIKETLPIFKGIKPTDYHTLKISYAELEELKVADYTTIPGKAVLAKIYEESEDFDFLTYKRIINSGYAVLQDYVPGTAETGEVKLQSALRLAVNLEALESIEIMKNNMLKARENMLIPAIRYLYAFNSLIDIYAKTFNFEDLTKIKIREGDIYTKMDSYNDLLYLLYKTVFGSEEQQHNKRELIKELFTPLFAEDFKPTEQAIEKAKAEVDKLGFTKAGREKLADYEYYINILQGKDTANNNRG